MISCWAGVRTLSTGSLNTIWSQKENFPFVSSVVDCVSVIPSARLSHDLRDAQKVCVLTIEGAVLKMIYNVYISVDVIKINDVKLIVMHCLGLLFCNNNNNNFIDPYI